MIFRIRIGNEDREEMVEKDRRNYMIRSNQR